MRILACYLNCTYISFALSYFEGSCTFKVLPCASVIGSIRIMGSTFNAQILVEKLAKLNNSQASIESILFYMGCEYFFLYFASVTVLTCLGKF